MKDPYWLYVAKKLPVGRSKKIRCCKDDKSASVSHMDNGYAIHCFRCGGSEFEPRGAMSISDIKRIRAEMELQHTKGVPDITKYKELDYSVPEKVLMWFLTYGVSTTEASLNGFRYCDTLDRVMLPVRDAEGNLRGIQARSVDNKPKYLNIGDTKKELFYPYRWKPKDYVVVVEDVLSAVKLSTVCPVVATLGTSFCNQHALKLQELGLKPIIWYDNDPAGLKGKRRASKLLDLLGIEYSTVQSLHDPKCYLRETIERELDKCLTSYYFG